MKRRWYVVILTEPQGSRRARLKHTTRKIPHRMLKRGCIRRIPGLWGHF